jgi:predicted anti-sigma-YlaC factor YlaD
MNKPGCEEMQMVAMAIEEGQVPEIPGPLVREHLNQCAACRDAVAAMSSTLAILARRTRRRHPTDLWPAIQRKVAPRPAATWPYVVLAVLLVVYELIELVPDRQWSIAVQIIPVLIAFGLFRILKQSPFQIATELRLEGE